MKQQQKQKQRGNRKQGKLHSSPQAVVKKISKSPLDNLLSRHSNLIGYSLLGILLVIIFHRFLSGSVYYMFKDIGSDTVNFFYPLQVYAANYLKTVGFPKWSHAEGMGQSIMSSTLMNPFYYILYLTGPKNVAYSIIWMEVAKIVLTFLVVYKFLKLWNFDSLVRIIGALLFSFSGFMIVGGSWYLFSTDAFLIALLLLAFEMLYQKKSWYLFPIAVALICIDQPFDLYLFGLFLIIYFLFRHFTEEHPSWKEFFSMTQKLAGFAIVGIVISSFILVSNIFLVIDSPRVGGESGYYRLLLSKPLFFLESKLYYTTAIMKLFANDLVGDGSNFKGWNNYLEAPMFYIGLLPLVIFPQFFLWSGKRTRFVSVIFLLIFIIPVVFPFFRYAFWLFTGDYFRGFGFFLSIEILLIGLIALSKLGEGRKVNILLLAGTLVVYIGLLWFPYSNIDQLLDEKLRSTVTAFMVGFAILVALYRFSRYRQILKILLLLLVLIEVGYMNYGTVNNRITVSGREFKQKTGYNDYSVEAIQYIKSHDTSFFRVMKDYGSGPAMHTSINDAKVQGYYGTASYQSFNQKYYIRFLEETEIIQKGNEHESRWAPGLGGRPLLLNLASNKYLLSTNPNSLQLYRNLLYDSVTTFGNVKVFRNTHFVPLGITYTKYIPMSDFSMISAFKKEITMMDACVIEDSTSTESLVGIERFNLNDTAHTYTFNDYFSDMEKFRQDTLKITYFSENEIRGDIKLESPGILFFSIPNDRGWHARINDEEIKPMICNIGFIGFYLDPGEHEVELTFIPPLFIPSLIASILGLVLYAGLIVLTVLKRKKRTLLSNDNTPG